MGTRRDYWNSFINSADTDTLGSDLHHSWDPDTNTFGIHTPIADEAMAILEKDCDFKLALDFGVGFGRNYGYLDSIFEETHGFDLEAMVLKSRTLGFTEPDKLIHDWSEIMQNRYDLVYECICFQHMDLPDLESKLQLISFSSKYLYIHARSYNDNGRDFVNETGGTNTLKLIKDLDVFDVVWSSIPLEEAESLYDETHVQALLKSKY
jgi:hypothetical protein